MLSPRVAALTEGVLASVGMTRGKALAVLFAVALLGGGGALLSYASRGTRTEGARQEGPSPSVAHQEARARTDREALQGAWVARSGESDGERFSDQQLRTWGQVVFTGGRFTRDGTERWEATYALGPDRRPREIDVVTEAKTWKGIYELDGTTLRLALAFGDERPAAMTSRSALLLVFEKK
jgi:uncharacterized protein (TIGR03067 family)